MFLLAPFDYKGRVDERKEHTSIGLRFIVDADCRGARGEIQMSAINMFINALTLKGVKHPAGIMCKK